MFGPEQRFCSVPEPSNNPTRRVMVGQTQTRTRQPAGFAGFGYTRQFQSPVLCLGFFYLWSHLDTLLLIAKY